MIFKGFRLPQGIVKDMNYISHQTGMSRSQMVRNGLLYVINEYFQKEQIKQKQIQEQQRRTAIQQGESYMSLPDGW